ncbi:MAG TPA: carbonic anhydrase [Actinomycetales bacterium]|jgi:carbonic anhydrase|nr:carbonic anhydrase [Actinomycetales bacterium]
MKIDPRTPAEAWRTVLEGNDRFVRGEPAHPDQDAAHRAEIATRQRPFATVFGCSDSRVAAEIIFDQGLGDFFVVRTAGHVVDAGVLGSLEFGVSVLDIPLIVVLGHDLCGAVGAAVTALDGGKVPTGYVRDLVERVTPSVLAARSESESPSLDDVEVEHVRHTGRVLLERSKVIDQAVAEGRLAIVGLVYTLTDGRVRLVDVQGDIGEARPV